MQLLSLCYINNLKKKSLRIGEENQHLSEKSKAKIVLSKRDSKFHLSME